MIDFLDESRIFRIPFIGKMKYSIDVRLRVHMVVNALREDFPQYLQESSRRKVTEEIFLNYHTLKKLPPKSSELLKSAGRTQIREMIPQLSSLIDWKEVSLISLVLSELIEFDEFLKSPAA